MIFHCCIYCKFHVAHTCYFVRRHFVWYFKQLLFQAVFGPFLKSFYVRSTDPTHVRVLKLEVLTNLASETNISVILREFQVICVSLTIKLIRNCHLLLKFFLVCFYSTLKVFLFSCFYTDVCAQFRQTVRGSYHSSDREMRHQHHRGDWHLSIRSGSSSIKQRRCVIQFLFSFILFNEWMRHN